LENLWLFALTSFLLIILPGPDTAVATRNTLTMGRIGGLKTVLGTCCAVLIHTTAAVAGLSAIIVKSALLFSLFKYAGAAYLIYLGINNLLLLCQKSKGEVTKSIEEKYDGKDCIRQGFVTNILNPHVAVFFLTFLPQFIDPGEEAFVSFLVMGITYCVLKAAWYIFYIYMIDAVSHFMKRPRIQAVLEGTVSAALIGFGLKLAFDMRR
jgi:threonine/homoserine/homoserine lactone efflux protein